MHFDSYNCVLCMENAEENISHLFFECTFSQVCWIFLGIQWELSLQPLDTIITARERFGSTIFRDIIIVASWSIWTHQSSIIIDGASLSFARWRQVFLEEMALVTLRVKPVLKDKTNLWLRSL